MLRIIFIRSPNSCKYFIMFFYRFDFNDEPKQIKYNPHQPSTAPPHYQHYQNPPNLHYHTQPPQFGRNASMLSPPDSPSKKTSRPIPPLILAAPGEPMAHFHAPQPPRARRPMNGFMLFAKHHRLKLIQQHPGKDNRCVR